MQIYKVFLTNHFLYVQLYNSTETLSFYDPYNNPYFTESQNSRG